MYFLADICESSTVLKVFYFIIQLIKIACTVIPIGLILMMSFDFFKSVIASEDGEMNKNTKLVFRRVLYCIIVFAIPTIVNLTVSILNSANVKLVYNTCISNATLDKIKDFETKEKQEKEEIDYTPDTPKDKDSNRTINGSGNDNDSSKSSSDDDGGDDSSITSQGAQRILDFAEKRYKRIEKSKRKWKHCSIEGGTYNVNCTTCCRFVSHVLKDAGYLKNGGTLCHIGTSSNPMGKKKLKNMKLRTHKKISDLKPGDVIIHINGGSGRSGNIAIFSHKKNGKVYVYGASSGPEIRAKKHPKASQYWKSKSGQITIVRATK